MKGKPQFAPRNPHVAAMRLRTSGAHGKTVKAMRKSAKQELRKQLKKHHDGCLVLVSLLVLIVCERSEPVGLEH